MPLGRHRQSERGRASAARACSCPRLLAPRLDEAGAAPLAGRHGDQVLATPAAPSPCGCISRQGTAPRPHAAASRHRARHQDHMWLHLATWHSTSSCIPRQGTAPRHMWLHLATCRRPQPNEYESKSRVVKERNKVNCAILPIYLYTGTKPILQPLLRPQILPSSAPPPPKSSPPPPPYSSPPPPTYSSPKSNAFSKQKTQSPESKNPNAYPSKNKKNQTLYPNRNQTLIQPLNANPTVKTKTLKKKKPPYLSVK